MTSLYNTWRPQTFADIVGQEHVARTLRNALARPDQLAHAYLFAGPRGTGKTTTARVLAKAVNCQQGTQPEPCNQCDHCLAINRGAQLDLMIEIDGASHTGVDDIRDLREKVTRRPAEGRYKVYIIDEVHMLSTSAFNALLKTLEEPPPHVIFVLATTDKVPPTVLSRCQRFDFKPVATTDLVRHLRMVGEQEKLSVDDAALEFIARLATGSVRDALSLLDQAASFAGQTINVGHLQDMLGLSDQALVLAVTDALLDADLSAALTVIQTVSDRGADLRQFGHQVVGFLRALMLARSGVTSPVELSLGQEMQEAVRARSRRADVPSLVRWLQLFTEADLGLRSATVQPQLPLELAVVQAVVGVSVAELTAALMPPTATEHVPALPSMPSAQPAPTGATGTASSPHRVAEPEPAQPEAEAPSTEAALREETPQQSDQAPPGPATAPLPAMDTPQPQEAPGPTEGGSLSLATIESSWPAVLKLLGRKRKVTALLRDARVTDVQSDELVLEFDHRFHAEQIEKPENRLVTEQALQRVFDQPLRTRVVVKGASDRSEAAAGQDRSDPVVRHALAVFPGATIIDAETDDAQPAAATGKESGDEHENAAQDAE
ncbi:MAG: DNA polymerase III subunit gamma/tau [Dehalococcoidia bacterium]|nr:DNA polymerase III subunit gamma/tau [Dehalococcoidia bacterium]